VGAHLGGSVIAEGRQVNWVKVVLRSIALSHELINFDKKGLGAVQTASQGSQSLASFDRGNFSFTGQIN
jgi:hypothetical protein